MIRLRVEVDQPYDVCIGDGVFAELLPTKGRLAVVVDENVHRLHGARIEAALATRPHETFVLPSGERHKTLETAQGLYDWLAIHRFERKEAVVAIGGGVTGDLAGFVAATWRRGVPFIQVPTTLLAQVDASVGGKVAVDHPAGKNLIGAFHQPVQVLADSSFLATLPPRELRAGLAEVVKTALLEGDPLLSRVEQTFDDLIAGGAATAEIVAACVAYKAQVVRRDPHEQGERAVLNLGHTVGHAIEQLGGYERLLHGEAVAWGLRATLALSGFATNSREMLLVKRLAPPDFGVITARAILDAMQGDKKVEGGRVKFVLLDAPGRARWGQDVADDEARAVVESLVDGRI